MSSDWTGILCFAHNAKPPLVGARSGLVLTKRRLGAEIDVRTMSKRTLIEASGAGQGGFAP